MNVRRLGCVIFIAHFNLAKINLHVVKCRFSFQQCVILINTVIAKMCVVLFTTVIAWNIIIYKSQGKNNYNAAHDKYIVRDIYLTSRD
jgi:hypothetical protein